MKARKKNMATDKHGLTRIRGLLSSCDWGKRVTNEPWLGVVWRNSLASKVWTGRAATEKPAGEIMDAVRFARERLGFEPDEEQARALRGGKRGIGLCSRQGGKSTVMAVKAVHRAVSAPGRLILV